MTDNLFDGRRARLDHVPTPDRAYGHGDFYRDVIQRSAPLTRFQKWMIRPWISQ